MSEVFSIIVIGTLIAVVGLFGWWLLVASEGAYLGRRVVVWLYDLYAHRYDNVKNYYPEYEQLFLADPIMDAIAPQKGPLVLDVATGTGRLPEALARQAEFDGFTIGVDLSRRMLHFATKNIYPYEHRAMFVWSPAESLPFPDNSFDIVTCLEALEFLAPPESALREMARVLRPGGLLLVTQRINTNLLPGRAWSSGKMLDMLEANSIENGRAQVWQMDYRKIWGRKKGDSEPIGVRPVSDLLCCPNCHQVRLKPQSSGSWLCENCGAVIPIGQDGVLELQHYRKGS